VSQARRSPKRQRLVLAGVAAAVLATAGIAAALALQDTAAYFMVPSDIAADPPAAGDTIRLGGLVKPGSVSRSPDGLTLQFVVMDTSAETPVAYRGLVPDLFREGQGVIATGAMTPAGGFQATQLLAKHDENYMPPEVAKSLREQGHPLPARPAAIAGG
jgi:cytochrome c-type biogenesis protein CcmE